MLTVENRSVERAANHNRRSTDRPHFRPPVAVDPVAYRDRVRELEQDWLFRAASTEGKRRLLADNLQAL